MSANCTLVILAAGIGSRYGGTKQLDTITKNGEAIIDFSVYDAIKAGFTKVVFVVRQNILAEIKNNFDAKLRGKIDVNYVVQKTNKVPVKYKNSQREKPWGTGHALLTAKEVVHENFCVINADDFYGFDAFLSMAQFLKTQQNSTQYALVAYPITNTLSKNGTVSRGECFVDEKQQLTHVVERTKIKKKHDKIVFLTEQNTQEILPENTLVSMNFWGFQPIFFEALERKFDIFLNKNSTHLTREFYLPSVVDSLIQQKQATVHVLQSPTKWMGVTYKEDKKAVVTAIKKQIALGQYPQKLWE